LTELTGKAKEIIDELISSLNKIEADVNLCRPHVLSKVDYYRSDYHIAINDLNEMFRKGEIDFETYMLANKKLYELDNKLSDLILKFINNCTCKVK